MLSVYSLSLILSQAAFGITYISPTTSNPLQMQKQIFSGINKQREINNESALKENNLLDMAAKSKLQDMLAKNYWDHTSPTGEKAWTFIDNAGYNYKSAGENLAKGFSNSTVMISAWMASPSHKRNILDKDFTDTGVAVGNGKINGHEVTLAVQLFGEPSIATTSSPQLVAGTKSVSPSFNLKNPLLPGRVPYFILYSIVFALLIFDGIMMRLNKEHKDRKNLNRFRFSLGINTVFLAFIIINIRTIF